jgi:hypothetical protein
MYRLVVHESTRKKEQQIMVWYGMNKKKGYMTGVELVSENVCGVISSLK